MFTLATFWMLFIPVFALGLGAVPHLVLDTPVLLIHLSRKATESGKLAGLALHTLFSAAILLSLGAALVGNEDAIASIAFFAGFGIFFAPAWAACFGWVYGKLCRDLYARPVPVLQTF